MKELMKKVLTNKAMRNSTALAAFVVAVAERGAPWN